MPTATSTSTSRRAGNGSERAVDNTFGLGLDVTGVAQETWSRTLNASLATMNSLMEVTQRINRELFESTMEAAQQSMKLWADVLQGTAERGSEHLKDAVETMADQMKDNTGQLNSLADETANRTRSAASRAS